MVIPNSLLERNIGDAYKIRMQRILEEGWNYLQNNFNDQSKYLVFLEDLSDEKFEQFLHTIYFYWAHDLYRLIKDEGSRLNIDGFMYQITLSIVEYLNKSISEIPKERIKNFVGNYFSSISKKYLNENIKSLESKKNNSGHKDVFKEHLEKLEFWEILYDVRNEFIHAAQWFDILEEGSSAFAALIYTEHRIEKNLIKYGADVRIKFNEYLNCFWEAYLNYFGFKKKRI